jgi:hypothetical protein
VQVIVIIADIVDALKRLLDPSSLQGGLDVLERVGDLLFLCLWEVAIYIPASCVTLGVRLCSLTSVVLTGSGIYVP